MLVCCPGFKWLRQERFPLFQTNAIQSHCALAPAQRTDADDDVGTTATMDDRQATSERPFERPPAHHLHFQPFKPLTSTIAWHRHMVGLTTSVTGPSLPPSASSPAFFQSTPAKGNHHLANSPSSLLLPGLTPGPSSISPQAALQSFNHPSLNALANAVSQPQPNILPPGLSDPLTLSASKALGLDTLQLPSDTRSHIAQPALPPPLGPHAIVTVIGHQAVLRLQWLRVILLLKSLQQRIHATFVQAPSTSKSAPTKPTVLFKLVCYRSAFSSWRDGERDDSVQTVGPLDIDDFSVRGLDLVYHFVEFPDPFEMLQADSEPPKSSHHEHTLPAMQRLAEVSELYIPTPIIFGLPN